ncbi:hypothetical protein EAH87_00495 [Sphingomonas koreensis]|nr:hypothetical protein EAH87_00495 [Sphingomonas koreensis]
MALLFVVVLASTIWAARKPLASDLVDRTLAADGVPASYSIDDLGLGRQRLTNLVIGDPAHPDLVADWIEVHTVLGLHGAHVTGLSAGRVRLRGRLIDGKLSLGAIDRLLPAPSGKPFALPALDVTVADARMRLETPQGVVGLKVSGAGMLSDGFSGRLAAVSEQLDLGGCVARKVAATVGVTIADARPSFTGPIRAAALDCGDNHGRGVSADLNATLGDRLDRWQGKATLGIAQFANPQARAQRLGGTVDFDGSAALTSGTVDLKTGAFGVQGLTGASLALAGGYRVERTFLGFQGTAAATGAALPPAVQTSIARLSSAGAGTPIGPLAAALAKAGQAAGRSMSIDANIEALRSNGVGRIAVSRLLLAAASGARATLTGGNGVQYDWPHGGLRLDGLLAIHGGGLPEAAIRLAQPHAGGPVTGTAVIRPYAAGGATLSLSPVSFTANPDGSTRFSTELALSGPLGDGRLDNGRIAVTGRWDGGRRLAIDPACAPVSFDRLAVSGLVLDHVATELCPIGGALIAIDGAAISGGARIAALKLAGRLGSTPIALTTAGATLRLADNGFALNNVAALLGAADRLTRLDFASLDGRIDGGAVAGRFAGGGGTIANVPLILSKADGDWRFNGDVLDVTGGLTVADNAAAPRFEPLDSHDVTLKLANNVITAGGTLANPASSVKVTDVMLVHDLAKGAGHADLAVPGISFTKGFQPEQLTKLTYGVIADVDGRVSGAGHIAWSPDGVTSTGDFKTAGTNLAAAFGPVTGLWTQIHFTDLLGLVSAPNQTATVADVNPGVPVDNGVISYQTLSSTQVKVNGGSWPFSGGTLSLEPTVLDFGTGQARTLTFRVKDMDAAQFLQQFDFRNISATGTFNGLLPMVFDENGGRVENGHLKVEHSGGSIAYVGDLTQKDLGTWGNMAFQALKSLKYDTLDITMNGPLSGEMVTQVRFAGIKQGAGTKTNFIVKRLMKLPFVFNVTIRAPFRQLLTSAQTFGDPSLLPKGKVTELIQAEQQQQAAPAQSIQPPESETVP